jgi:hypothetical protein
MQPYDNIITATYNDDDDKNHFIVEVYLWNTL